jgi:hypothetical protein
VLSIVEPLEVGDAVNAKEHSLAIKDELLGSDAAGGLDDQRIAACPVVAVAGVKPDPVAVARDDQPIAVLFDLVDPVRVRGDFCAAGGDAGNLFLCMSVGLGVELVGGFTGVLQSLAPIRRGEVCYSPASADDAIALFKNTEHLHRVRSAVRTWNADLHVSHRSLLFLNKT